MIRNLADDLLFREKSVRAGALGALCAALDRHLRERGYLLTGVSKRRKSTLPITSLTICS